MHLRHGIGFPSSCRELALYRRPVTGKDPNGFYRLLGLTPAASDEEVRRAGRRMLALHHPDGTDPDEDLFLGVAEAYEVLTEHRDAYDQLVDGQTVATHSNRDDLSHPVSPPYKGWSYFSEVPRVTDDRIADLVYAQYLYEALRVPTSLPYIAVVLIPGDRDPWLEDGLIYAPVSSPKAILEPTPSTDSGPKDKADKGHVTHKKKEP